jgi:hypothetical protein
MWIDTNPAWPEMSVDHALGVMGLKAVWSKASQDNVDEYELVPDFVEGINPAEAGPFDPAPLALSAVGIYARPASAS